MVNFNFNKIDLDLYLSNYTIKKMNIPALWTYLYIAVTGSKVCVRAGQKVAPASSLYIWQDPYYGRYDEYAICDMV